MRPKPTGVHGRAGVTVGFLVLAGMLTGIAVDRLFLLPERAAAAPLTAEGMADQLGLTPGDEARVRSLLDSLHAEVMGSGSLDPAAMVASAERAHERLEAALPPELLPRFRLWMQEHHRQLVERVEAGATDRRPADPDTR